MEIAHDADGQTGRLSDLIVVIRDTIRRRWLTLLLVSLTVCALGVTAVMLMPHKYSAAARVRIDPGRNPMASTRPPGDSGLSSEAIETEVSTIASVELGEQVVKKLNLVSDSEYQKMIAQSPDARALSPAEKQRTIAEMLVRNLGVGREKLTYILTISYTSGDPQKSAEIANAFAEQYLEQKVGTSMGTAQRQADWSKQRVEELGKEAREADAAAAAYRARSGIVQAGGSSGMSAGDTVVDQQIGPLSGTLANAESEAAAARAAVAAARQQMAQGRIDSIAEVRQSAVVGDLRRQRAEILNDLSRVQARYGDRHPESIRVRDQLAAIDSQIADEASRVVSSLVAQERAAEARAASLRNSMGRLEAERANNAQAVVTAESLERDAAAKRSAYERMSQSYLESTQAARNQIAQAVIIDRAQPPKGPTSPNKPLLIALVLVLALGAGSATIAVQELMVSGLRTIDDIEGQFGIPVLAAVPKVAKNNPADLLLEKPTSLFAEALRIARTSILGVKSGRKPQVIAITSALPNEGKTTTALAFARTLAINRAHTLLIDCDVRRAAMRELVKDPSSRPGLVELLHGEATLDDVIEPGDIEGLDHLLVRSPYFSSEDLFGDGSMDKIIEEVRKRYELVVLDLPPLVGLADGRYLTVMADVTALVVRWDATPGSAVASAVSWLRSDGANLAGAIFTQVDTNAEAIGGIYYSKKYSQYYQAA